MYSFPSQPFSNCFQPAEQFFIFMPEVSGGENPPVKTVWGWIMRNYQDPLSDAKVFIFACELYNW